MRKIISIICFICILLCSGVIYTKDDNVKGYYRKDGTYVRFDDNAGVVIDKQGLPRGTRVLGPIAREVKEVGYNKIASLAREVV